MRRGDVIRVLTPPLLLCLAALSGCSSPAAGGARGGAAVPVGDGIMTPVERSALRERAIAELERQAFAEWALLRANAMEGLSPAPARAQGVVRAGLADDNEGVRAIAAMLAGELGMRDSAASLRAMRSDPSPLVRIGAIAGLAMMGEEVDQTPLARMLEHEREDVRRQAAFALGEIGNPSAIPLLRSAVRGKAGTTPGGCGAIFRMQAAEAMVKLGETEALNAIRAGLYPATVEQVEAAVIACQILGEVGDTSAAKQLVEIVEFTRPGSPASGSGGRVSYLYPPELRLAAATALVKLGYEPRGAVGMAFQEDAAPTVRAQVAFLYGEIGSGEFLERLELLMDDPDPLVRIAASASVVDALATR
ncbi:MAG: hypothetical protein Tsb0013_20480 [Phycisphaerales bacterium]